MELTIEQLKQLLPKNPSVIEWHQALTKILPKYDINTPKRIAAFIAQCSHESGGFMVLKENLNYRPEALRKVFPKYFPTDAIAREYATKPNKQEAIASRVYANRMGNGDEASKDGWKYCGRGLIQLTGKQNYTRFAESVGMTLEDVVQYLQTLEGAVESACWYWKTNNLNRFADVGDIKGMTRGINGGYIGISDRTTHYEHALRVLGVK